MLLRPIHTYTDYRYKIYRTHEAQIGGGLSYLYFRTYGNPTLRNLKDLALQSCESLCYRGRYLF